MRQAWVNYSKILLWRCMVSREDAMALIFGDILEAEDLSPDGNLRQIFTAIQQGLADNDFIPSPEALSVASVGGLKYDELAALAKGYHTTAQVQQALRSCRNLRGMSEIAKALDAGAKMLKEDGDHMQVRQTLIDTLSGFDDKAFIKPKFSDLMRAADAKRNEGTEIAFKTGFDWVDSVLDGGVQWRRLYAIGAPEKNRKSSFIRNILLNIAIMHRGKNVKLCLLNFENDAIITSLDFVTMRAAQILWGKSPALFNQSYGDSYRHSYLRAEALKTMNDNVLNVYFDDHLRAAWQQARDELENAQLYIYDRTKEGGGLRTLSHLKRTMRAFRELCTTEDDLVIYVVDHIHLVRDPKAGNKFAALENTIDWLTDATDSLNATVFALAQYNRAGKTDMAKAKSNKRSKETDVMATSGSSELEWNTQAYFDTQYSAEEPDILTTRLRRSRRSAAGLHSVCKYRIHPASGAILGVAEDSPPIR